VIVLVRDYVLQHGPREWTADHASNLALYRMICGFIPSFPGTIESISPPATMRERYAEIFGEAGSTMAQVCGNSIGSDETVLAPAFAYISARRRAAHEPRRALEELTEWLERLRDWPTAHMHFFLAAVKIAMYIDETEGTLSCSVDTTEHVRYVAQAFQRLEFPYWYADALLTCYILWKRYQGATVTESESLFKELLRAYASNGRTDRMRIAYAATRDEFNPLWLLAH
jgi:hypothetical protein